MSNSPRIGIVGLGYVGLPVALQFAEAGCRVLGFDTDTKKVGQLDAGKSYILHIPKGKISAALKSNKFSATTDFTRIRECSAIIICVPTPLKKNRTPDLSFILDTA